MDKLGFINPPLTLKEKRQVRSSVADDSLGFAEMLDRLISDGYEVKFKPIPTHSAVTVNITPISEEDINSSFILSHFGGDFVVVLAEASYWMYVVCGEGSSWEHNAVSIKYFDK